jgi:catechol 2,3-dioxygenase-like lactoylglutathione lyase family enzyme
MRPKIITTTPLFVVSELQRALDWYAKLGFGNPGIWGEPPCFAMIHRDGFEVMLSLAEDPSHIRPNGVNGNWDMYVRVPDLDAELAALHAAGVTIDKPIRPTEYDMRELELVDPDGYRVCFAQDVKDA